ncbi:MAG: hypothetical protein ABIG28_02765 [archaeon]
MIVSDLDNCTTYWASDGEFGGADIPMERSQYLAILGNVLCGYAERMRQGYYAMLNLGIILREILLKKELVKK